MRDIQWQIFALPVAHCIGCERLPTLLADYVLRVIPVMCAVPAFQTTIFEVSYIFLILPNVLFKLLSYTFSRTIDTVVYIP